MSAYVQVTIMPLTSIINKFTDKVFTTPCVLGDRFVWEVDNNSDHNFLLLNYLIYGKCTVAYGRVREQYRNAE